VLLLLGDRRLCPSSGQSEALRAMLPALRPPAEGAERQRAIRPLGRSAAPVYRDWMTCCEYSITAKIVYSAHARNHRLWLSRIVCATQRIPRASCQPDNTTSSGKHLQFAPANCGFTREAARANLVTVTRFPSSAIACTRAFDECAHTRCRDSTDVVIKTNLTM
jgi:hypothetical protein